MRRYRVTVYCTDAECGEPIKARFCPGLKARTYGPIDQCYPEEPPSLDLMDETCPRCGKAFTQEDEDAMLEELQGDWE